MLEADLGKDCNSMSVPSSLGSSYGGGTLESVSFVDWQRKLELMESAVLSADKEPVMQNRNIPTFFMINE